MSSRNDFEFHVRKCTGTRKKLIFINPLSPHCLTRAAGIAGGKPVRRAAAATRRATAAPSASIRTGRSTIMSAVKPSRPSSSSSKPASSREASPGQRPPPPSAPPPAPRAAEPGVRLPPRLLQPLAPPPPAPRPPLPWMAHRAKRLERRVEATKKASGGLTASPPPAPTKQHDCLHCLAKILS